jgi:hypothetical protein
MIALLEVILADNQARYGFDVVTLAPMEAEFLFALNAKAPLTASYDDLSQAIWGKRPPEGTLRMLASTAARLRIRIAAWDFAILCQSRIGYRLIRDWPMPVSDHGARMRNCCCARWRPRACRRTTWWPICPGMTSRPFAASSAGCEKPRPSARERRLP